MYKKHPVYDQNICLEYKKSVKEIVESEMALASTTTILVSSGFPESRGVERALPQSNQPHLPIHQLQLKQWPTLPLSLIHI